MPKSQLSSAYASAIARLVTARKSKGVTQIDLAKRLGKTQQWVSAVELCDRRIDIVEFTAIVRAIGGDPLTVFGEMLETMPAHLEI